MIKDKKDLYRYLSLDRCALGIKEERSTIRRILFPNKILRFQILLRYLEYYTNNPSFLHNILRIITWYRFRKLSFKLGFSIPINVFGPGLSIAHYGTIIVNPNSRIGAFCRLHACVNIGASGGGSEAPQIGDNCYIGPSVVIFGNIKIADNTTIGANATVNKSHTIPNCVLAGTPAKTVKENSDNWTVFNNIIH